MTRIPERLWDEIVKGDLTILYPHARLLLIDAPEEYKADIEAKLKKVKFGVAIPFHIYYILEGKVAIFPNKKMVNIAKKTYKLAAYEKEKQDREDLCRALIYEYGDLEEPIEEDA